MNNLYKYILVCVILVLANTIFAQTTFNFGGYVKQTYLSKPLKFVELKDIGYEKKMKEWMINIKGLSNINN